MAVAPTVGIDAVAAQFLLTVFGFERGEHFITDRSSVYDFVGIHGMAAADIRARVQEVYGLDLADVRDGNLREIFKRLLDPWRHSKAVH